MDTINEPERQKRGQIWWFISTVVMIMGLLGIHITNAAALARIEVKVDHIGQTIREIRALVEP